jgi:ATP adenylyltransferase
MDYETLIDFVQSKMRMSHIYQPVMLMTLLKREGRCHEREIAKSLLGHDESQIEYYTEITNNMVGRVLRNHEIVARNRETKTYELIGYDILTAEQRFQLIEACQARLQAFLEALVLISEKPLLPPVCFFAPI